MEFHQLAGFVNYLLRLGEMAKSRFSMKNKTLMVCRKTITNTCYSQGKIMIRRSYCLSLKILILIYIKVQEMWVNRNNCKNQILMEFTSQEMLAKTHNFVDLIKTTVVKVLHIVKAVEFLQNNSRIWKSFMKIFQRL